MSINNIANLVGIKEEYSISLKPFHTIAHLQSLSKSQLPNMKVTAALLSLPVVALAQVSPIAFTLSS
jgi:hypothetical protein